MNLLGRHAKHHTTITARGAVIVVLGLLLVGCQTLVIPHPIPVKFDTNPNHTTPIHQEPKNNPKKVEEKTLPKFFYLLENWF